MLPQEAWRDDETILRIPEAGAALLTVEETASYLHVSLEVLQSWAAAGVGPPFYGWAKTPFYLRDEVAAWLSGQPQVIALVLAAELEASGA